MGRRGFNRQLCDINDFAGVGADLSTKAVSEKK